MTDPKHDWIMEQARQELKRLDPATTRILGNDEDATIEIGFKDAEPVEQQTGTLGAYLHAKYGTVQTLDKPTQHGEYNKPGQGVKYDAGKQKFDLIPFDLMDGEQRVWEFGAKKYAPMNWRKGMPISQPLNAAIRHLTAMLMGQDKDPETGESHLDHAICCIRMAQNTKKYFPDLDDRNVNPFITRK